MIWYTNTQISREGRSFARRDFTFSGSPGHLGGNWTPEAPKTQKLREWPWKIETNAPA
jgi:hypothetical protein